MRSSGEQTAWDRKGRGGPGAERQSGRGREAGQRHGRLVTWAKLHSHGGYKSGYYRAMR